MDRNKMDTFGLACVQLLHIARSRLWLHKEEAK